MSARAATLRSTVGREAAVPRKRRLSDMVSEYKERVRARGPRLAAVRRPRTVKHSEVESVPSRAVDEYGPLVSVVRSVAYRTRSKTWPMTVRANISYEQLWPFLHGVCRDTHLKRRSTIVKTGSISGLQGSQHMCLRRERRLRRGHRRNTDTIWRRDESTVNGARS